MADEEHEVDCSCLVRPDGTFHMCEMHLKGAENLKLLVEAAGWIRHQRLKPSRRITAADYLQGLALLESVVELCVELLPFEARLTIFQKRIEAWAEDVMTYQDATELVGEMAGGDRFENGYAMAVLNLMAHLGALPSSEEAEDEVTDG